MQTLTSILKVTPIKELLRAVNSDKEYLFFDISVFNVGMQINIRCTNTYKQLNRNTWNGYDFFVENCNTTKFYIVETLKELILDRSLFTPNELKN